MNLMLRVIWTSCLMHFWSDHARFLACPRRKHWVIFPLSDLCGRCSSLISTWHKFKGLHHDGRNLYLPARFSRRGFLEISLSSYDFMMTMPFLQAPVLLYQGKTFPCLIRTMRDRSSAILRTCRTCYSELSLYFTAGRGLLERDT